MRYQLFGKALLCQSSALSHYFSIVKYVIKFGEKLLRAAGNVELKVASSSQERPRRHGGVQYYQVSSTYSHIYDVHSFANNLRSKKTIPSKCTDSI